MLFGSGQLKIINELALSRMCDLIDVIYSASFLKGVKSLKFNKTSFS